MWIRIRDPEPFSPWIRDGKIRIRDKHPGSATLLIAHQKVVRLMDYVLYSQRC